jgi:DNA-binding response OmpR family regulator
MQRILVIDDDPTVTRLLKRGLFYEGFSVIVAGSGEAGLSLARDYPPDLVVLDITLPEIDGLDVLRQLQTADPDLPVIVLAETDTPEDQIRGLEAGADDYVVKPFTFTVLLARIRAVLRRQHSSRPATISFADLTIDTNSHQVQRAQREIVMTSLEFKLLQTFLEHPQQVLPKETLLDWVWRSDFQGGPNIVEVYVKQLRQKLEAGGEPRLLHTIRGAGYILREVQAGQPADQHDDPQLSSANPQLSLKSRTGNGDTIASRQ